MLLGQEQDKDEKQAARGFLGPLKEKWSKLPPRTQKTVTLGVIVVFITVVAVFGYQSRKGKAAKKTKQEVAHTREVSLNTDLIEKSLFRQAQETINQQSKLIAEIRREIAKIKAQSDQALEEARKAREAPRTVPKKLNKPRVEAKEEGPKERPSLSLPPPPPPPPPIYAQETGKKGEPITVIGGIEVVENKETGSDVEAKEKGEGKKKYRVYLPPSFMEATLLSGLDAVTTARGNKNPVPVLLRIKDLAVLPNHVKANLKGCFVLGEGKGNLATERVDVRLLTLSCLSKGGESVIDQKVKGYVVDEDGKAGLRGVVAAKMGAMLARAALAGFLTGIGEGVEASAMTTQVTALGTTTQVFKSTDTKNILRGGIGSGISTAAQELQKFYLELARQTLPIIQVGSTKTVTVVISEGVELEVKSASIVD